MWDSFVGGSSTLDPLERFFSRMFVRRFAVLLFRERRIDGRLAG